MTDSVEILIVAGEASGDAHAAKLVRAMVEADRAVDLKFFGAAGPNMRQAGVDAVVRSDDLSVVGIAEIGRALPMFLRTMKTLKAAAKLRQAKLAILVDFPDFNLKLAKWLKTSGFRVVYYISPQLWAWRKYRLSTVKNYVDLVISILPFEKDWYLRHGVKHVEYVGSPLAREVVSSRSKSEFCSLHGLDASKAIVSLLPGSRRKEIARILPVMLEAATILSRDIPSLQFVIPVLPGADGALVGRELRHTAQGSSASFSVVEGETYDALNASDAAVITSGTATLEAGIIGTPMVVVYKTSGVNYRLLEPMIDVPHYGLINLIAGERIATELIQDQCTSEAIAREIRRLLDPATNTEMRGRLRAAADELGHGGASKRAARLVLELVNRL